MFTQWNYKCLHSGTINVYTVGTIKLWNVYTVGTIKLWNVYTVGTVKLWNVYTVGTIKLWNVYTAGTIKLWKRKTTVKLKFSIFEWKLNIKCMFQCTARVETHLLNILIVKLFVLPV